MEDWRKYERLIAGLISEEFSANDMTVVPNAKLIGKLSGCQRQIDVLIDKRFEGGRNRRIIVDAKKYSRPIHIKDVESFEGMLRDCTASKGILVCPNGYSDAAKRRAQDLINIRLVSLDELENLDLSTWDECCSDSCDTRKNRGLVLWDSPWGISPLGNPLSICCTGKCDECNDFHVWCWDCGQKFALGNEDEHQCCSELWFWLTAIEEDVDEQTGETYNSVYLLLPSLSDVLVVDRKPLA
jgi:hypothetical protein